MIDFSVCPDLPIKKGQDKHGRGVVTNWLNSLTRVPNDQDSSGGQLKQALTSSKPLFVTSYQYVHGNGSFTCMNVRLDNQDYRLFIGYDNLIIKTEKLDAGAAEAQIRKEEQRWATSMAGAAAIAADSAIGDVDGDNYNSLGGNDYANHPSPWNAANPTPESPYGVKIPASRPILGGHR